MDYAMPPVEVEPVTTIAWRLGHIITGCLGARSASHFGSAPVDPGTAAASTEGSWPPVTARSG